MVERPAPRPSGDPEPTPRRRSRSRRLTQLSDERFAFDLGLGGGGTVAGADEAGRGCLAGPLVAAAVCFDYSQMGREDLAALACLDDSKKLNRTTRALLYREILRRARQVAVASCSPRTIDRDGLHHCNLTVLAAVISAIAPAASVALVDGFKLPEAAPPHQAVVGGDGRSAAIAAASIIAKVTRDRLMIVLHERYPDYGFDRHVGYATRAHREAIAEHGVCALHRLSFASLAYDQLELGLGL